MKHGYTTIEFIISWAIFISLVFYVIVQFGSNIIREYIVADNDVAFSRSMRLFYMLFFTPGKPADWSDALSADAIGFSDSYYEINKTKLENFMNECNSNYEAMVYKIGRPFYVSVSSEDYTDQCPKSKTIQTISRTMTIDGKPAVVEVGCI